MAGDGVNEGWLHAYPPSSPCSLPRATSLSACVAFRADHLAVTLTHELYAIPFPRARKTRPNFWISCQAAVGGAECRWRSPRAQLLEIAQAAQRRRRDQGCDEQVAAPAAEPLLSPALRSRRAQLIDVDFDSVEGAVATHTLHLPSTMSAEAEFPLSLTKFDNVFSLSLFACGSVCRLQYVGLKGTFLAPKVTPPAPVCSLSARRFNTPYTHTFKHAPSHARAGAHNKKCGVRGQAAAARCATPRRRRSAV